ncbi:MAG: epoxyqueuosine reductase, partial [Eubacterium sp.]
MNGIKEKIRQKALEMGAVDVGWADLEAASVSAPDDFKQALCIVVPLNRGVISHIQETPTHAYYAHYVSVNRLIDDITLQLALLLEAQGYPA